jgi:hypothetical protein
VTRTFTALVVVIPVIDPVIDPPEATWLFKVRVVSTPFTLKVTCDWTKPGAWKSLHSYGALAEQVVVLVLMTVTPMDEVALTALAGVAPATPTAMHSAVAVIPIFRFKGILPSLLPPFPLLRAGTQPKGRLPDKAHD